MEASNAAPVEVPETTTQDPVAVAMALMQGAKAAVELTVGGGPGAVLPKCVFPRLSFTRRVLGTISEDVDETAYGPRNTLGALTRWLMTDVHTTNPRNPEAERFDITNSTQPQQVQAVLDQLNALSEAGLIEGAEGGPYTVTDAGREELAS